MQLLLRDHLGSQTVGGEQCCWPKWCEHSRQACWKWGWSGVWSWLVPRDGQAGKRLQPLILLGSLVSKYIEVLLENIAFSVWNRLAKKVRWINDMANIHLPPGQAPQGTASRSTGKDLSLLSFCLLSFCGFVCFVWGDEGGFGFLGCSSGKEFASSCTHLFKFFKLIQWMWGAVTGNGVSLHTPPCGKMLGAFSHTLVVSEPGSLDFVIVSRSLEAKDKM